MAVILDILVQLGQLLLVLLLAPLLTGYVRKIKARLVRRQGPDLIQPYRDLHKLLRKEVVLADNASWIFRTAPYLIFATTWVAAALVPTFATGLTFPRGLAFDRSGNLFVADVDGVGSGEILKFTPDGNRSVFAVVPVPSNTDPQFLAFQLLPTPRPRPSPHPRPSAER